MTQVHLKYQCFYTVILNYNQQLETNQTPQKPIKFNARTTWAIRFSSAVTFMTQCGSAVYRTFCKYMHSVFGKALS